MSTFPNRIQFPHIFPTSLKFVDHRKVDWQKVRRTHYWMYQRFHYEYPGPIQDLHQRLIVVPPRRHGNQYLFGHKLRVTTDKVSIKSDKDRFGNFVYYVDLPEVEGNVDFEVWSGVERVPDQKILPSVLFSETELYLEHSSLTEPDAALREAAREIGAAGGAPLEIADRINTWVWKRMVYKSGVTNVATTAAQALALSQGLCQDYAQIMISICRILGIPARYVSGHLLGEGGSHAWVEVLVPSPRNKKLVAVPYDPTNHCRAGGNYITIAVGRDYRDVSPTSGYYTAPYQGQLTSSKQAGLVHVQLEDGMCLKVDDFQLEWSCEICA